MGPGTTSRVRWFRGSGLDGLRTSTTATLLDGLRTSTTATILDGLRTSTTLTVVEVRGAPATSLETTTRSEGMHR